MNSTKIHQWSWFQSSTLDSSSMQIPFFTTLKICLWIMSRELLNDFFGPWAAENWNRIWVANKSHFSNRCGFGVSVTTPLAVERECSDLFLISDQWAYRGSSNTRIPQKWWSEFLIDTEFDPWLTSGGLRAISWRNMRQRRTVHCRRDGRWWYYCALCFSLLLPSSLGPRLIPATSVITMTTTVSATSFTLPTRIAALLRKRKRRIRSASWSRSSCSLFPTSSHSLVICLFSLLPPCIVNSVNGSHD